MASRSTVRYPDVASRRSSTATTPRSSCDRMRRPAPWASASAAAGRSTSENPLPPLRSTASRRACSSGSSGRPNGSRSMTTSRHARPGTSRPCQNARVATRQLVSSLVKSATSLRGRLVTLREDPMVRLLAQHVLEGVHVPPRRAQHQRAPAGRVDELTQLLRGRFRPPVVAHVREVPGHVEQRLLAQVEGRLEPARVVAETGTIVLVVAVLGLDRRVRREPEAARQRLEAAPGAERGGHEDDRRLLEQDRREPLTDLDRREPEDGPLPALDPRDVVAAGRLELPYGLDARECESGRLRLQGPGIAVERPHRRDDARVDRGEQLGEAVVGGIEASVEVLEPVVEPLGGLGDRVGLIRLGTGTSQPSRELTEPSRRHLRAQRARCEAVERVRLVDDHDVVLGQQLAARPQVRRVQRMVDDHDLGIVGALARLLREAAHAHLAAVRTGALVRTTRHRAPRPRLDRCRQVGDVARVGVGGERVQAFEVAVEAGPGALVEERLSPTGARELREAEVVGAAFEQRAGHRHAAVLLHERQVLAPQLVLERERRGSR